TDRPSRSWGDDSMANGLAKTVVSAFPGSPKEKAYWLALGRFIEEFAIVELLLNFTLWRYAKLDKRVAQGLIGQQRVDRAMQDITRIVEARGLKGARVKELQIIFDQLCKLNRARNDIVHFGTGEMTAHGYIVTNRHFAHLESRVREIHVSPKILESMYL